METTELSDEPCEEDGHDHGHDHGHEVEQRQQRQHTSEVEQQHTSEVEQQHASEEEEEEEEEDTSPPSKQQTSEAHLLAASEGSTPEQIWGALREGARVKTLWKDPLRWEFGTLRAVAAKGQRQCKCTISYDDGTFEREALSLQSWPHDWDVEDSRFFECQEAGLTLLELQRWVNMRANTQAAEMRELLEARDSVREARQQEAAEGRKLRSNSKAQSERAAQAVRQEKKEAAARSKREREHLEGQTRADQARSRAARALASREQLFCSAGYTPAAVEEDGRPRVQPQHHAVRTGVMGWLPADVVSYVEGLMDQTTQLVWRASSHTAYAAQQQRDTATLAEWQAADPSFEALSRSLLRSSPLCPHPPSWLRTLLAEDGMQVPTCKAYIEFARRSREHAVLLSRRVVAQAQLQQLTSLLQLGSWAEAAVQLGVAADDAHTQSQWDALQTKCESVRLCETFPMHLGSVVDGHVQQCPPLHNAREAESDLELIHAHFVCEVPLPKPSCRGPFPMGDSAGALGTNAVRHARQTRPSVRAVEAALLACPSRLQGRLADYLRSGRTRFTIILDFFEAMQGCARRCTLAALQLTSLLGDACLSSCGYTISAWDLIALGAVLSGPGVQIAIKPRNAVANGHDIWWPAKGCARRVQACREDSIAPHDVAPWSFGATPQYPQGLNLRNLDKAEQVLLFYLALPAKRMLVLSQLLHGSHSIVSHDVGSAVAAAATAHQQGLLHVRCLGDLHTLASDELATWRRMQEHESGRAWTVAYIGRTVGPYVAPKTKVVSTGHLGRAHSLLLHSVDGQGRSILKGLSLPGTAKPPHGKLVEVCSDAVTRSNLSNKQSNAKWHPFTSEERGRAAQRARLIYTKARIVALEGSHQGLECVQSPYLGAAEVWRPALRPTLGDGTLSFAAGGICFLQPYEEQARREIRRPGGLVELLPSASVVLSKIASDHVAFHSTRHLFPSLAHLQGTEMHTTACNNGILPRLATLSASTPPHLGSRAHSQWVQERWPCPKGVAVPWATRAHRIPDEQEWEADQAAWTWLLRVGKVIGKLDSRPQAVQGEEVDQLALYQIEQVAEGSSDEEESATAQIQAAQERLQAEQDAAKAVRDAAGTELATPDQQWELVQLLRRLQEGASAQTSTTLMFSRTEIDAEHVQSPAVLKSFPRVGYACRKGGYNVRRAASLALFEVLEGISQVPASSTML